MVSDNESPNTAIGPDEIHNEFLKQLQNESVWCLLNVFNNIWTSDIFPETRKWKIIIPIPDSSKDTFNLLNYRPIALTRCLSKTMERMINNRLSLYLESNVLITKQDSAEKRKKSRLSESLLNLHKKQRLSVFFFRSGDGVRLFLKVWCNERHAWFKLKWKSVSFHAKLSFP